MDDSESRRQYAEQIERAAEQRKRDRGVFSDRSKPAEERRMALQSLSALTDEDEVAEAIDNIRDREEDAELRAAALRTISAEVGQRHDLIDFAIDLLRDRTESAVVRLAALRVLQMSSFRVVVFDPKRPEYLDALRTVIDDQNASLREQALEILAQEKDEYAQRRLLEGLEDPSQALVPPERAIQMLGYDIHAEHYPILREMVSNPPSPEAKREAVRLLGTDPESKNLLADILKDKRERREVRNASASALQSLAPAEFEEQAKQIVLDDDEYPEIRATAINALTLFADQEALDQDADLSRRVERLREVSPSEVVARTANRFLRRQRRRRERRNRSDGPRGE
jgi:HEAT repeat protein